jgi:PAS domain S-box-containing protein
MQSKPHVLIVDDEEIVRLNFEKILSKNGFQTSVAADGNEAIKLIQKTEFDLVLTDLVMEEIDGIRVLEEAKRFSPETVVIIVTGYGSLNSAIQSMQKGAFDYLIKPCEKNEMIMRVAKGIEKRNMERKINEVKKVENLMSNIGIFTLDHNGVFLHSSSNLAQRIWNMPNLDGKKLSDLPSAEESGLKEGLRQALEGRNVDNELLRFRKEGGDESFILSVHFRPLIEDNGKVKAVTLIIEEISQRVRVIEKISQAERLSALGKLAAGVAHEINNPLNIISLDLEFMKSRISADDPCRENLNSIAEEVDRIALIVQQLQDHVKLREGTCELIDLNDLFHEHIFSMTFDQLAMKQVSVRLDLFDDLPPVQIPKTKITQVLMNLIKNAEDAMGGMGELTISTEPIFSDKIQNLSSTDVSISPQRGLGDFVAIKIKDTGIGIQKKHLDSLFEPFFTTKGFKGTGLGLFISYSIVKSYNGSISVSSEPGSGTEFSIVLPSISPDQAPRPS